ncbi:DUF2783 domain-containing protein [Sphingomonas sp. BGYR3]|uniref:DUF2783 domain-containing protein n=1 Tax=Sphingomonas sp. BGYR3 TaxID=2975483 RepID=UPI0021A4251D|nr:DUF2783 domain-containing protein [Sphingomonas sp. BGYR3]MDG5487762.1 DUF2783 domain-containing protein [Sphingomonas sp. BGYR3]
MTLALDPRLHHADMVYQQLIALHEGRSQEESNRLNARLILLLANQVGDDAIVLEAIAEAKRTTRLLETPA